MYKYRVKAFNNESLATPIVSRPLRTLPIYLPVVASTSALKRRVGRSITHRRIDRQMSPRPELIFPLPSRAVCPMCRYVSLGGLRVKVKLHRLEILQQPDKEEGHLVVGELLPKADARPGVEGKEDEGIGGKVFVNAIVEEAVRVEFFRCSA